VLAATSLHAQEALKIGAIFSTSGPGAFLGVPEERGLRMKVEEINKAGGIGGRKVEVVVYDSEGNTGKAAQLARRLIESDQVVAVVGPSSSGESLQVLPIANELKTPLIAHAGTEKMTNPVTPWVFNTPPTDRVVAAHLLSVFKKRGITQLALLSAADGFGQSGANVVKELAPKYGVTIARHEEFNRTDADMTAQVLKAKDSQAQAMLVWSAFPAPTIIARNAAAVGYAKPMYNSFAAASKDLLVQAGPGSRRLLRLLDAAAGAGNAQGERSDAPGGHEDLQRLQGEVQRGAGDIRRAQSRRHVVDRGCRAQDQRPRDPRQPPCRARDRDRHRRQRRLPPVADVARPRSRFELDGAASGEGRAMGGRR
jgi:ABC-type branched-subunit amino acid transport system substrate-binding protein